MTDDTVPSAEYQCVFLDSASIEEWRAMTNAALAELNDAPDRAEEYRKIAGYDRALLSRSEIAICDSEDHIDRGIN